MASDGPPQVSSFDGQAPESTDYANYFCTYAFLYHQKDMLEDHKRTGAYYQAVVHNRSCFEDKVVLDVGTGSGILAVFAAKAGARKVYAVEATSMARFAKQLVKHNGYEDVVEVIQGTMESVHIPEKVDIIISEWMGYFLLRESMLDSVLVARDKYLKPDGAMYPSHARMYMAPARSQANRQRKADFEDAIDGWSQFTYDVQQYYDVDLACLSPDFVKEQKEYYMQSAAWTDTHPAMLIGPPACFKEYDLRTVSLEEVKAPLESNFTLEVTDSHPIEAFCGYFDVQFLGSPANPTLHPVTLSTAPDATGATHWGQQSFFVYPAIPAHPGDKLHCWIQVLRKRENHRLMQVVVKHRLEGKEPRGERTDLFQIE